MEESEKSMVVVYRTWCEECDWEDTTEAPDAEHAQKWSGRRMFAHGLRTGHHETRHEEVNDAE